MTISTDEIHTTVEKYLAHYPGERDRLGRLLAALRDGSALTSRREFRGHVTCGAVLLDRVWRVLHISHNTHMRWLLPGGHVEPEDDSLPAAALREAREETGIEPDMLTPLTGFDAIPFDIDVHHIPAKPAAHEPEHWHYDFRYAFQVPGAPTIHLQHEEVSAYEWLTPDAVPGARLRMKLQGMAAEW